MKILSRISEIFPPNYKSLGKNFAKYFMLYGGWKAILRSPYLHISVVMSALSFGFWKDPSWWSTPIGVLPNLIGFTLGGYAILISFGNERFINILTEPVDNKPASIFMAVNATFVHFIVVQVFALMLALFAQSRPLSSFISLLPEELSAWIELKVSLPDWFRVTFVRLFWFLCYTTFIYAVVSTIAGTMAIFWLGGWFERLKNREREALEKKNSTPASSLSKLQSITGNNNNNSNS